MSEIIRKVEDREMAHIVKIQDKFYYIDSVDSFDCGYETMAFECDKEGEVSDWGDLYCARYQSFASMKSGHDEICENLENYLY